jgi:hypothetical protein
MADTPTLRAFIAELDALEVSRARNRAFVRSILPHLTIAGEEDTTSKFDPNDETPASFDVVARRLNEMGIRAARGGPWSKNAVRRLMLIDVEHEKSERLRKMKALAMVGDEDWRFAYARAERRHNASLDDARKIAEDVREALGRPRDVDWNDQLAKPRPKRLEQTIEEVTRRIKAERG